VLDDQRAQYFGQVSEHLKPKIATKFWAWTLMMKWFIQSKP
jgi:hypothetical protein